MSNGAPKSANANGPIRVADGCFRVECDPLPGFSHELPGASPVYGTLRFTPAERVRAPRCSEICLVNVGKAHFNHHFSVRDPFAIATALSFARNDSQWPATHRHCKNRQCRFVAFEQELQRLPVIFSSFFYWQGCLLWKRPAGKH